MKFAITSVILVLLFVFVGQAQSLYPVVTIKQVQEVPVDSLKKADAAGLTAHTTLDDSPYNNDTVSVWGVVMSKVRVSTGGPLIIPNSSNAYVFYIADTTAKGAWTGIQVRATDTVAAVNSLVTVIDTGMVVKVTGRVMEFNPSISSVQPVNNFSSTTQFEMDLDPGSGTSYIPIEINPIKMKRRPAPTVVQISDLFKGTAGQFETGERWEGCYIEVRNVTVVVSYLSGTPQRMTIVVEDANGNRLKVVDDGYYFSTPHTNYNPPPQGAKLAYVRGFIANRFGLSPLYPNDIMIATFPPNVSTVQRNPRLPKSTDAVTVTGKVKDTNAGGTVTKAELFYGINGGALQSMNMTINPADSSITGTIPAQSNGSIVRYQIVVTDNDNEKGSAPSDTTVEFYFYKVLDGAPTIRDIQFTPFTSGNTGFSGIQVSLRGVVTSDTANLGANYITIQDGTQPWSGIMIDATKDSVKMLTMGDDVTISGTVGELFNVTRLSNITSVVKNGKASVPQPVNGKTQDFKTSPNGILNGDPIAEKWESMLIQFNNLTVTMQNADAPGGNFGEFAVSDGTGNMRVDDIGKWKKTYSNGLASHTGSILLVAGTKINSLTGTMYYAFSNYKLEPRDANDFVDVNTIVERVSDVAESFRLHQNYPNPFSASNGNQSTTIQYEIPASTFVTLHVFDALGRDVKTLVSTSQQSGSYRVTFNAENLSSGVYYYQLSASGNVKVGRMILVR